MATEQTVTEQSMRDGPIHLNDLPHHEARRLVAGDAPVWVFVNPVEYHGPHLSLHNDALVAKGIARDLHAALCPDEPFLVGGDLELGVDPCRGPGTRAASYDDVRSAVVAACRGLSELGADRVVLMTFHGAPLHAHALEAGCAAVRHRGGRAVNPMNLLMDHLVGVDGSRYAPAVEHVADPAERQALLDGIATDFHAGFLETSLAMHYAPASVSPVHGSLPPCPPLPAERVLSQLERAVRRAKQHRLANELWLAARSQGWASLRPFPGYTGAPHHANAASGAYFARQIVALYQDVVRDVLAGLRRAPKPVMPWVLWATLGGRLDAARPLDPAHVQSHAPATGELRARTSSRRIDGDQALA